MEDVLWEKFQEWIQTEEGQQAIKDSGGRFEAHISPFQTVDAFAMAGRSFIAGWIAREKQ